MAISEEKLQLYLVVIVGVVAAVGILVLLLNTETVSSDASDSDLTGQVLVRSSTYEPPCNWYRCSELMRQRCAEDRTGAESFTIECCGRYWTANC